jgi:putative Holliday junction resolvase
MRRLATHAARFRRPISNPPQTILGLDFGTRRIGLAVGDAGVCIAHPAGVIDVRSERQRWERLEQAVEQWRPALLVVGLPVREDGGEHELSGTVRAFGRRLEKRFGIAVQFVDERFTSAEAAERLRGSGLQGRAQKQHLDEVAAMSILQSYFDRGNATS